MVEKLVWHGWLGPFAGIGCRGVHRFAPGPLSEFGPGPHVTPRVRD
jgi:hypothetical protein